MADRNISEQEISILVDRFYAKVMVDPEIGPIFNRAIHDWGEHLALLKRFWSSVLLTTGTYKGNPMMTHLQLPLERQHFQRWLALFEETAQESLLPEHAEMVLEKAHRIAENFLAGIAYVREQQA